MDTAFNYPGFNYEVDVSCKKKKVPKTVNNILFGVTNFFIKMRCRMVDLLSVNGSDPFYSCII